MSTDRQRTTDTPFGYTFEEPEIDTPAVLYPPPNERPLLHDEESGFLESFFNNPNDVDPNSLTSMASDFHNDGNNMFNSATNFDWLNATSTDFPNASNTASAAQADWQEADLGQRTSGNEALRSVPTSSDVYAAAGILHNNNAGRQQNTNSYNGYSEGGMSGVGDMSRMNGYQYPPLNSSNGSNYNFNSSTTLNSPYSSLGPRFSAAENSMSYTANVQGRHNEDNSGGRGLNFGTDDSFRNSIFNATSADQPDKDLAEALKHSLSGNSTMSHRRAQPAPAAVMRKRNRGSEEAAVGEGQESGGEDSGQQKRRRVGKTRDEEEDEYGDGSPGRGKKGRRKRAPSSSSATRREAGPNEKRSSRTQGGKGIRENLSEEQKRNNHIQSEQKRRNLIKQGFDDLNRMVPELRSGSLSKSNMLLESARFIKQLKQGNQELEALIKSLDKG